MEDESAIYKEIAAGGSHVGVFYEELARLGRKPEEIQRGVEAARAQLSLCQNNQIGLRPIPLTQCT